MNKKKHFHSLIALALAIMMVVPAALGAVSDAASTKPKVKITTSMSTKDKVYIGTKTALNVKTSTSSTLSFKTSNSKVAAVKSGKLYAYKPGTAKIQIYAKPKSSKYQTGYKYFIVDVLPGKPGTPDAEWFGNKLSVSVVPVKGAQHYQFQYATNNKMTSAKALSRQGSTCLFAASNKKTYYVRARSYATVSGKTYYSGWSKIKKVPAESKPDIPVTDFYLSENNINTQLESGSFTIKATVYPSNATNQTVTWTSSNTSVATVDSNGRVTPLKEGKTKITAKVGNLSDSCDVNIMSIDYMVKRVIELTNIERAKKGVAPLQPHPLVQKGAMVRAKELEIKYSHTRPDGRNGNTSISDAGAAHPGGENIAYGQMTSDEVVEDWMNSTGHRVTMLNPSYSHIGVGVYKGNNGTFYWTQEFTTGNPDDKVTLTLDTMGGAYIAPIIYVADSYLHSYDIPVPSKPGYEFVGWYQYPSNPSYMFTGLQHFDRDMTLYAKWVPA